MNKTSYATASILLGALGGGLIYQSAADIISVGADSIGSSATSSWPTILVFIGGLILIGAGIITALMVFSSIAGAKRR